ncbi:MAG TPA: SRPBCC family protein [Xanthomonadales bacterium]|nr:SRPBCC family protein [Xanthomonadales bacterium]
MIVIERAVMLNADAEQVFHAFVDPDERHELMRDYVHRVECDGSGLGSVYTMWVETGQGQAGVRELTVAFDSGRHSMEIEMIDTGGIVPFGNYRSRLDVQEAGKDGCVVVLQSSFVPVGIDEADARVMAETNYAKVFDRLAARFGSGKPGELT